jgi:beta-glucosidase
MHDLLVWLSNRYGKKVPIFITENGCDAPGESQMSLQEALNDTFRVNYYSDYLDNVMKAIDEGVNVQAYFAWSLMVSCPCIMG